MRVVSGIQPTGNLHLGNYLGAIRQWVAMQDDAECFFFLADLHALSMPHDPAELSANTREMAAALIASGIDPDRSTLFNQARVPQHAELQWLLSGTARMGWLNRMTQFKDKSGKNKDGASIALFTYPVLQAADVLAYNATHVPVGEDQRQHLELARDIAQSFNERYGVELFTLPAALISQAAPRIMSLRDGTVKMSKSDPSEASRINLTDDSDLIAQKVRKAKTDPAELPASLDELADRPEAKNLVTIYAATAGIAPQAVLNDHAGKGFGAFKPVLADLLVETLRPIQERFVALKADPAATDALLAKGAAKARETAAPLVEQVYGVLGLLRD